MITLETISNLRLRHDAEAFSMDIAGPAGSTTLEVPIAFIPDVVAALAAGSEAAATARGAPTGFPPGERLQTRAVKASAFAVVTGAPGEIEFVFRVGAADFAFSLHHESFRNTESELAAALAAVAATQRARN